MKTIQLILFFVISTFSGQMWAQGFEGTIQFKAENFKAGENSNINWVLKNGNNKINIETSSKELNSKYSLYFLKNSGNITMTADGDGKKLKYNLPLSLFSKTDFQDAFYASETGKTSVHNGFEGKEVMVKTSELEVMCIVSQSTGINPEEFPSIIFGKGIFNVLQRNGIKGVPVYIRAKDYSGNPVFEHQIIQIIKQSIGDNEFVVPSDYQPAN